MWFRSGKRWGKEGKAGAAGVLVAAVLAASTSWETAAPPAVVTAAPSLTAGQPDGSQVLAALPSSPRRRLPPKCVQAPASAPAPPPAATYLAPGVHEQQVDVDGMGRRWTIVVPSGAPATARDGRPPRRGWPRRDMRSAGFEPLAAGRAWSSPIPMPSAGHGTTAAPAPTRSCPVPLSTTAASCAR